MMRVGVSPRIRQVDRSQRRKVFQDLRVGPAEVTVALQEPHRDTRPYETCIPAEYARRMFDARPRVRDCGHENLKEPRLISWSQLRDLSFKLLYGRAHPRSIPHADQPCSPGADFPRFATR